MGASVHSRSNTTSDLVVGLQALEAEIVNVWLESEQRLHSAYRRPGTGLTHFTFVALLLSPLRRAVAPGWTWDPSLRSKPLDSTASECCLSLRCFSSQPPTPPWNIK